MELSQLYYQLLLSLILDEYRDDFVNAKPGHCMKITGLAMRELQPIFFPMNIRGMHSSVQIS